MERNEKNYKVGLDIGTSSVGWAVIGQDNKLIKKGNDPLWGYSLFDEGESAANRRLYRSTRRRYTRRKQRIHLLQDLCSEMIYPVDNLFFKRLENSYLLSEDRDDELQNGGILFKEFESDNDYYEKFPTIYHLRNYLMNTKDKADPRLIYLALHHIVKYRGNFLYEGQNFNIADNKGKINDQISDILDRLGLNTELSEKIEKILFDDKGLKKDREKLIKELGNNKEEIKILGEIAKSLFGYSFNPGVIVGIENEEMTGFSDAGYEEFMNTFESENGELANIVYDLQSINSILTLKDILKDNNSISESMIAMYDIHKKDLKLLKNITKNNLKIKKLILDEYYEKYINSVKLMSKDVFYENIKNVIGSLPDGKDKAKILSRIEEENFLPRQNSTDNGSIPYQLHYLEAKTIIDNQKKYYKCLENNEEKILSIISFKRPYYLGPSKGCDGKNKWAWLKTNSNEPIRPWNWKEVVDVDYTAKKFIDERRNHCTYILSEPTLPKNSVLLARFNLLNELNKIRIDGKYLFTNKSEKEEVINSLFLKKDKVTEKDLRKWLFDKQKCVTDNAEITGFQNDGCFASNLQTERKFRKILGDRYDTHIKEVEEIIEYITVYAEKDMIKRRIEKDISINLSDDEVKTICNIKLSGYGQLSRKLISGLVSSCVSKKPNTIIGYMYDTNDNFMQVLNNKEYGFLDQIKELNNENDDELSYEQVEKLHTSPANKRAIWQSIRVVNDIKKYMKHDPEAIYIEFAREEGEKKRTNSRFKQLEKIYKEYCNSQLCSLLKQNENRINDEKIYLYFMQQGKCMYSGKELHIENLEDYQVDHILPQSYIKDDSLENKALVYSKENQRKKDNLLLDSDIIRKQKNWWKELYDLKLIGPKKYHNLTREVISEKEKSGFVSRQLVETRQICVHVRDLLKNAYTNSEIGMVHAPLSTEFRQKNNLYKIRNLNSAHHANDAYLAVIIGSFIKKECPYLFTDGGIETRYIDKVIKERIQEESSKNGSGAERNIYSIVIHKMNDNVLCDDDGVAYWNGSNQIAYIKKAFNLKSYFFNYLTRDYDGGLYNSTIYPVWNGTKGSINPTIRIKNNRPVEKYGGFSSEKKAYAVAVEYSKKNKLQREVIDIPVMNANNPKEYLVDLLNDKDLKCLAKVKFNQTFICNGTLFTMSSATEWSVREPLFLEEKEREKLYKISHGKAQNYDKEELIDLFMTILKKIYIRMPFLKDAINTKIGGNKKLEIFNSIESQKYARSLFSELDNNEIAKIISQLVECITSKSHPKLLIGENKISDRFGRKTVKTTKLDEIELVYTSPSGIYKVTKKL